jgi:hypothetical protein
LTFVIVLGWNHPVRVDFVQWPAWQELMPQHRSERRVNTRCLDQAFALQLVHKRLVQRNSLAVVCIDITFSHHSILPLLIPKNKPFLSNPFF